MKLRRQEDDFSLGVDVIWKAIHKGYYFFNCIIIVMKTNLFVGPDIFMVVAISLISRKVLDQRTIAEGDVS